MYTLYLISKLFIKKSIAYRVTVVALECLAVSADSRSERQTVAVRSVVTYPETIFSYYLGHFILINSV